MVLKCRPQLKIFLIFFLLLGLLSLSLVLPLSPARSDTPGELRTRTFEFVYTATLERVAEGTRQLKMWLPYPKTDEHQDITDVQIDSPVQAAVHTEPLYGNTILYVDIEEPESAPYRIQLKFKVLRREYLRKEFSRAGAAGLSPLDSEIRKFLKPERLVPITEGIRQWAREVTQGKESEVEKVRAIYDYALSILKYDKSGQGWGQGDLLYVCDEKRGNCTDFHALFIGFCRGLGIPARFSMGFPLPAERGEGGIPGYHCWAEFYLRGYGWIPVDASEAWRNPEKRDYYFGGHDENRVQLSVGRDIVLRPRQEGEPLNYFVYPYVEADGKPLTEGLSYRFYFRDLPG